MCEIGAFFRVKYMNSGKYAYPLFKKPFKSRPWVHFHEAMVSIQTAVLVVCNLASYPSRLEAAWVRGYM